MITNYSQILDMPISDKTAGEIERIVEHIKHPVIFKPLPINNPIGFGRADFTAYPEWIVYSIKDLPQKYFEANLLHELYHLCQVVECFPTTKTKKQPNLNQHDQSFLDGLGGFISSLILDLDVCDRIDSFGLNSNYFFDKRYNQAMSFPLDETLDPKKHKDSFISMTVRIAGIILQNKRWQSDNVVKHFQSKNPLIVQKAKRLANKIKKCDHNTPLGCLECLITIYDYLDIWSWQLIHFQDNELATSEQAHNFLTQFHLDS